MASFALFLQCSYYSDLLCLVSAAAESDTAADVVRPVAADVNDSDDDDSSQLGADDTAAVSRPAPLFHSRLAQVPQGR